MTNVFYIPLDERPCNLEYPRNLLKDSSKIKLTTLPNNLLPNKKSPVDLKKVWEYIFKKINSTDIFVFSFDFLMYGSLLNSRIHNFTSDYLDENLNNFRRLFSENKNVKFYSFSLIMRCPSYNSSDEEPQYYENWGYNIYRNKYLSDKFNRSSLSPEEEREFKSMPIIPREIILDYENRRNLNRNILDKYIELVSEFKVFHTIPQDDSSEFGYTALDRLYIYENHSSFITYSGADEATVSIIGRALNDLTQKKLKIFVDFSVINFSNYFPMYEGIKLEENLTYHLKVSNFERVYNVDEADVIVAYNIAPNFCSMSESWEQNENPNNNIDAFSNRISEYIDTGRRVALVDSFYANGGDIKLAEQLDNLKVFDKLYAYSCWNTNCNSLGSAFGTISCLEFIDVINEREDTRIKNLYLNSLEQLIYQSYVRSKINKDLLPGLESNYFDISKNYDVVKDFTITNIYEKFNSVFKNSFQEFKYDVEISFPWKRLFEISITRKREYDLCIDIGGTTTKYHLYNGNEIIEFGSIDTEFEVDLSKEVVLTLVKKMTNIYNIKNVGISTAGVVNTIENKVIFAGDTIKNYTGTDYNKLLREFKFNKVRVDNDSNCNALGEYSNYKQFKNVLFITLGTGVGASIILNGELYRGSNYFAGNIGNSIYENELVDNKFSVRALVNEARQFDNRIDNGIKLFEYMHINMDVWKCYNDYINNFTSYLHNLNSLMDFDAIVLGGGISENVTFFNDLRSSFIEKLLSTQKCEFKVSLAGNDANLTGALSLLYK